MPSLAALDRRTPEMRWREARDEASLWGDLRPELAGAVSQILHATMEDELAALLVARPYERSLDRAGYRNGRFRRWLATELGAIELCVPRARGLPYRPSFLERAARRTSTVDELLRTAFLRGLSTRETAVLAERLTGVSLSAAAVSRLSAILDGRVASFHRRPISLPVRYLLLDGLWVSVRDHARRATKRVVLAAYGVTADGRRATGLSPGARRVCGGLGSPAALAHRARSRSGRRRSGGRRWGRRHRCCRWRGLPGGISAALLDTSGSQPSGRHPESRAQERPGRTAGHLSSADKESRGGRLLALCQSLARPSPAPGGRA